MAVADSSLDLIEAKLAPPPIRPVTVAKTDVIGPAVRVAAAVRDRHRARRVRQDHPARAVGRGGSASLRVGRPRRAGQRRRPVHAVHRRRASPRRADRPRGLRRAVRPGRLELVHARAAPRERADGARERPLVLVLDDLHVLTNPSCLDVLAALLEHVPAGSQIAIASREEPALPLARWRMQGRLHEIGDGRPAARRAGGGRAAAGARASSSTRPTSPTSPSGPRGGRPGSTSRRCRCRPGGPCAALRCVRRRRPAGLRVLPRRAAVPAAGGRGPVPDAHVGARADVRQPLRRAARDHGVRCGRSSRWSDRTGSSCRSTAEVSGTATTTCSASSCGASSSAASPRPWRRSTAARWPGASPGACPRPRSTTGRPRARRRPSRSSFDQLCQHLYYSGRMETARGVARVVRRGGPGPVPGAGRLRRLVPRAERAVRRGRAVALPRRRGRPRPSRSRTAARRSSPGSPTCAPT